ncbi:hypothetical protein COV24_01420 [candidate division WWE3 bacterium CG10_big_fil_rev_8_21_14_0_10_32_10]|uniref:Nucleoid-associated protein, YbaB/EbfC family n=1 Tax=candidate division WWE3 bacterium CG10_big_fil_rev_8_21_14_0_10_32_10 TaxID=1975090 RepID=A0A2H0RB07_UNCKA|nr:MAG: hypothetical protein COV24_01420 [candidate division WWE3 bacterium CG10_big_fil_rev_8_21_14_0_10_32_10]
MLGKVKQVGEALKAQKKLNDLKKKLETVTVDVEEGNVKLKLKGSIAMYEVASIEVNGEEVKMFSKALKKANKQMMKEIQKKAKTGELGDMGGMM